MAGPIPIEPDLSFKKRLMEAGGETLSKCFQCGTCTVACPLSPDANPFPRKELLWSQWGLKDRLLSDPDVWLCHQCNDCSQLCPRKANPGDVLAVVRQSVVEHYSAPGFLARMVASPKWLPVLFAVPALLMLIVITLTGGFSAHPEGHSHFFATGIFAPAEDGGTFKEANFDHFFAHYPIIIFFTGFVGLALLGGLAGLIRYWKALETGFAGSARKNAPGLVSCVVAAIKEILTHEKFKKCEATATRYWGHLLLFYGFMGMFTTTAFAAILYYTAGYPFGLFHPVKMLGNVSGLLFLVGLGMVLVERLKSGQLVPRSGYVDWLFIVVIGLTVVSGIICQAARLANAPVPAYTWYFVHLLFVFFLLVYLPYSKFAHLLYRTVAMVYSHYSGRETALAQRSAVESGAEEAEKSDKQERPAA